MNDEQILVLNFLRCNPQAWFTKKEIARRAVKRKVFEENQHWADDAVAELLLKGEIERDGTGLLRVKQGEVLPP